MVDGGDAPVISSDDEVVDERRRDEGKTMAWSTCLIAFCNGEDERMQELQVMVTFGLGWGSRFAAN
jgi:hypothetical protein